MMDHSTPWAIATHSQPYTSSSFSSPRENHLNRCIFLNLFPCYAPQKPRDKRDSNPLAAGGLTGSFGSASRTTLLLSRGTSMAWSERESKSNNVIIQLRKYVVKHQHHHFNNNIIIINTTTISTTTTTTISAYMIGRCPCNRLWLYCSRRLSSLLCGACGNRG